jgi:hypothetical protein
MLRLEVISYLDRLMSEPDDKRAAGWAIVKPTLEANRDPDGEEWEQMNAAVPLRVDQETQNHETETQQEHTT